MFQLIYNFWAELLLVFVPRSPSPAINIYHRYVFGGYDATSNIRGGGVTFVNIVNFLSISSLLALCIFLFYQVYKLIHAFVGGFYE